MAENITKYSVPVAGTNDADAPQSAAERQQIHEQLHQEGRAVLDSTGFHVEPVRDASRATSAQEVLSNPLAYAEDAKGQRIHRVASANPDTTRVPVPDGKGGVDMMPLSMALNSNLYQYRQNTLVPTFELPAAPQAQQQQQQQTPPPPPAGDASDAVGARQGDAVIGHIATVVGDAPMYAVIQQIALGQDVTQAVESIAQIMEQEPQTIREALGAIEAEYSDVGRAALESIGVTKIDEFMSWARSNRKGEIQDAYTAMVSHAAGRSTAKLKVLGRAFIAETGGGYTDAELQEMNLPDGASWARSDNGRLLIRYMGQTLDAQAALRSGLLK